MGDVLSFLGNGNVSCCEALESSWWTMVAVNWSQRGGSLLVDHGGSEFESEMCHDILDVLTDEVLGV